VSLPWLVLNWEGLLSVYRTWWRGGATYGSVWLVPGLLGHPLSVTVVTTLAILGWVTALVVGAAFALSLDRRPTVAEISLVMLVIVLVTGKSVPVQAGLWLLPLIALVGLKWRDHLIWAGFEATYFVAVWLYIAGLTPPNRGLPVRIYCLLLGLRIAAMLFVLVQVWRVARSRPAQPPEPGEAESVPVGAESVGAGSVAAASVEAETVRTESVGAASVEAGTADADVLGPQPVGTEPGNAEQVEEVDPLAGPLAGAADQVLVRFG
jgi:hypothetical protein